MEERNSRRKLQGVVVSDKMQKTIVVLYLHIKTIHYTERELNTLKSIKHTMNKKLLQSVIQLKLWKLDLYQLTNISV